MCYVIISISLVSHVIVSMSCDLSCDLWSGDDGEGEEPSESHIVKRSDNSFVLWASGRVNCDGLLMHLEV